MTILISHILHMRTTNGNTRDLTAIPPPTLDHESLNSDSSMRGALRTARTFRKCGPNVIWKCLPLIIPTTDFTRALKPCQCMMSDIKGEAWKRPDIQLREVRQTDVLSDGRLIGVVAGARSADKALLIYSGTLAQPDLLPALAITSISLFCLA
ncbi:hypothetical protein BDZ89DRAFT_198702 [Hymenopellis radicata]|nr:hypothetical protein BDZ89DRAFT_198702 [Hymenopellis radicata]